MGRKRELINKKGHKHLHGECRICKSDDYHILDNHRIISGKDGGRYTPFNTVVLCSNCHRLTHSGKIHINGYVRTTMGLMLSCVMDGEQKYL